MSSDRKEKFTTQATSKAADQTIVSDTIVMPDNTEKHILSVKADSSCSGEVDVELEMSPDGTNWCPAVTRTVSVTPGESISARTGNEEYVKLTPDAGEFKNKHCRGGLNFDTSGAVVTPDGSGARDLMHQHIATNKSFNYSQWFKTSEAPTTTYKPVLFRNGGYDNFENKKAIQLEGINEVLSLNKYAKYPSDSEVVYEADFPISDFEGTDWLVGVTRAGDPNHSGAYLVDEIVTVEIGDFTAGDYIQTSLRDDYSQHAVYVGDSSQSLGSYQAYKVRENDCNQSHQSQSNTLWIHHPAFDSSSPHSTNIDYRFKRFSSDSSMHAISTKSSFPGTYASDITASTSTKIRVKMAANANATKVLQNLVIYQLANTDIDANIKARVLTMKSAEAPIAQGHTLLAAYNFGDVTGVNILDRIGSNDMIKTYSGSDTLEGSDLALAGGTVRRPALYAEDESYLATTPKAGFNASTTSGLPDLASGFAVLVDRVFPSGTSSYMTVYQAKVDSNSLFYFQYGYYNQRVKIGVKDRYGNLTGDGSGSPNTSTITFSSNVGNTGQILFVVPPRTSNTDNFMKDIKVYTLPDNELDLSAATTSDLATNTHVGFSTYAGTTGFQDNATEGSIGMSKDAAGGGASTTCLFNGSITDQEALDLLISLKDPSYKDLDTVISGLSGATLASAYAKDMDLLTSSSTSHKDQNGSNDGTFGSAEQVIDLYTQGNSTKKTQNLTGAKSTYTSTYTTIGASSGQADIAVTVGSDAATFYGSSSGTDYENITNGNENDIGKHMLGIYKPDVSFSSSRWLLVNRDGKAASFKHRGDDWFGYMLPNYYTSTYVRFYGRQNFSPFITYSPSGGSEVKLRVYPNISEMSTTGYWYLYADTNDDITMTFTKVSGGNLVVNLEDGFHSAMTYDPPSDPSQGIPASSVKMYINGIEVTFRTTTENGVDYVEDAAPADNLFAGDEVYGHDSSWGGSPYGDYGAGGASIARVSNHIDFGNRILTQSEVQSLYNSGKLLDFANMQTSFPISLTNCVGAYDSDVILMNPDPSYSNVGWGYKDCSSYGKHILYYTGSNASFAASQAVAADYNPTWMASPVPILNQYFVSGSDLSISGWVKTTDTGILFSNTEGAYASGLKAEVTASGIKVDFKTSSSTNSLTNSTVAINDGNWHHILLVLEPGHSTKKQRMYIDGVEVVTSGSTLITESLRGNNGFTLLSDGQENANNSTPSATDSSKLGASLSNWSIHAEALDINGALQLYSNGNVRNVKNLPSISTSNLKAWWQLNDSTNPQNDLVGTDHLRYTGETVAENTKGIKASTQTSAAASGTKDFELNNNKNPFGNNNYMPLLSSAFSMSFWINIPSGGSGVQPWDAIIAFSATDTRNHFKLHNIGNNLSFSFAGGGEGADYTIDYSNKFAEWHHIVMIKPADTVQQMAIFIDGIRQTITQTYNTSDYLDPLTTSWGTAGSEQTCSEFYLFGNGRNYTAASLSGSYGSNRTGRVFMLDELGTYSKELTHNTTTAGDTATGEVASIYNSGNFVNLTDLSNLNLEKYFKFGDCPLDVNSGNLRYYDEVNETVYFEETDNTDGGTTALSSSDPMYSLPMEALSTKLVNATGETLVEDSINGNAMTLSLTKSFNFTTKKWVSTADQDSALCLSLNGFQEQAEYFAVWKCSQTIAGSTIDICDGEWHNVILSYRGNNDLSGDNVDPGDTVKFGPGPANSLAFNWAMSYDGNPLTSLNDGSGADYIGGNNIVDTDTYNSVSYNVGFAIQDRHLKYISANTEEEYKPHAQFSAGIHEVSGVDNINSFQGSVDETSFHSDNWWADQAGTSIISNTYNQEKPATIYGNTTALGNRQGASTDYPEGKPYDLLHPERLTTSGQASDIEGTNQYINPNRKDSGTNPNGGLEGWWRWGDTPGDCSITINDVKDHNDSINARDISAFGIVTADRVDMSAQGAAEDIYITDRASSTTSGSAAITFPQVIVQNIESGVCNLKDMVSPILKYLRVKFTGAGSCDLGDSSVQAQLNYKLKE